ncbi:MAG: hypothetical protein IKS37_08475 [Solobacterium sp.]|nr:hypothetical protein [Solobacterium sp.]
MRRNRRLHVLGYLYFSIAFLLFLTRPVQAYIDPSVMTYAIQAISGIAIALGTVFSLVYRKIRRKMNLQETEKTIRETNNLRYTDPETGEVQYALSERKGVSEDLFVHTANEKAQGEWRLKDRIVDVILPAFLFVMTLGMFFPSSLFLGNINEFPIEYNLVFPILLGISAVAFIAICFVVSLFPKKAYLVLAALLFAGAIGLFVQSAFLNPVFDPFNGQEIEWGFYTKATVLSVVVWLVLICGAVWASLQYEKKMVTVRNIVCVILSAVEIVSLCVIAATTTRTMHRNGVVTKKDEFVVSKHQNTIVFVVDTLDGQWVEDYVLSELENREALKDFTFFSDVVSEGAPTILGMPKMLTGVSYDPDKETVYEYYARAYEESSMLEDIADAGWRLKLYTDLQYFNGSDITKVYNVVSADNGTFVIRDNLRFAKQIYKFAGFYTMPMPLKRFFWTGTNAINEEVAALTEYGEYTTENDPFFYQDFERSGVHAEDETNDFILYHLFGAHGPYFMDENAQAMDLTNEEEGLVKQIHGCMKILRDYLDQLKASGAYDNTTFIITADHGGRELYQNPAVLVKRPNETHDAVITDSRPLTFDHLYATYARSVFPDRTEYGETLFEGEGVKGPRYHTAVNVLGKDFYDEKLLHEGGYTRYRIDGTARGMDHVSIAKDE